METSGRNRCCLRAIARRLTRQLIEAIKITRRGDFVSEKNMDDLLAQLKAEFEPARESKNSQNTSRPSQQKPQNTASAASMEQMLDELRTELELGRGRGQRNQENTHNSRPVSKPVTPKPDHKYRDRLKILIEQDYQMQAAKREAKAAELRKQEAARIAEQKRRQQELIEAQQREELRERKRKEAMRVKAQKWLQNLNLRSEEGQWFEEFSYSYENKLEAAIDYLEAMRESGL